MFEAIKDLSFQMDKNPITYKFDQLAYTYMYIVICDGYITC